MRAGLVLITALVLCATPAVAQAKAKAPAVPGSVQVLEICESFATNAPDAVEAAIAKGWDAFDQGGESPFIKSYAGSKDIAGLGYANIFVLIESYPDRTFGYCRADVMEPTGDGQALVQAIQNLGRYKGEAIQNEEGSFASLGDTEGDADRMLLTQWTTDAFVVQLSVNNPKTATVENPPAETVEQSNGAVPPAGETAPSAQTTEEK